MIQPIVQPYSGDTMINKFNYRYRCANGKFVTVPAGFVFDGNSTPVNRFKPSRLAGALIHDYLYRFARYDDGSYCSRLEADKIYFAILKKLPTYFITRTTFYIGLRLFGWRAWNKWRRAILK